MWRKSYAVKVGVSGFETAAVLITRERPGKDLPRQISNLSPSRNTVDSDTTAGGKHIAMIK